MTDDSDERLNGERPEGTTLQFRVSTLLGVGTALPVFLWIGYHYGWPLTPVLLLTFAIVWHTRKRKYASLPGLAIGFFAGTLMLSTRSDVTELVGLGVCGSAFGASVNAIVAGFRASGSLALGALVSYLAVLWLVQAISG